MSMIRTIHTLPGYADIVVLYHGTAPGTFAFSRELEYLASVDSRITVYYSLGDRSVDGTWEGMVGRLTTSMIEDVAPDANGRHVYACGPEGYLDVATQLLLDVGVDDTAIHVEYFTGAADVRQEYKEEVALAGELAEEYAEAVQDYHDTQSAALDVFVPSPEAEEAPQVEAPVAVETQADTAPAVAADAAGASTADFQTVGDGPITMSFVRSRLNVRIGPEQRILQVAQQAGVRIGANCQEGMCGSCKSVKLSGEVEMNHQGGIRQREIDAGKFLPCCSTATTDLVIDA
jgi:ferredoxin